MANKTLKALVDTQIKSSPKDSSLLPDSDKFSLLKGQQLEIVSYRSATNNSNHWEIELAQPNNGRTTFFAFLSHVEIFSDSQFKTKLTEIATEEWEFFGKGTKTETENGFFQRIGVYWQEALNSNLDGKSVNDQGKRIPWSAAFISWVMKKAGAGDKFKYSALHAVYITDSIKKRTGGAINVSFVGFRRKEVSPEVGDLVCNEREPNRVITYDTTGDYASHCDLVVAKRSGEIDLIGGNVDDSVGKKTLKLDTDGKLTDATKFIVIRNVL